MKKYFGDTIVVVIGVLAALAVSEWVKGLDERATTRAHLVAIIQDFEENAKLADEGATINQFHATHGKRLLEVLSSDTSEVDSKRVAWMMETSAYRYSQPYLKSAWEDLLSSGKLGYIKNPETRRGIGQFYRRQDQKKDWEQEWLAFFLNYRASIHQVLPALLRLEIGEQYDFGKDSSAMISQTVPDTAELIQRYKSVDKIEGQLVDLIMVRQAAYSLYSREKSDIEAILKALKVDLSQL